MTNNVIPPPSLEQEYTDIAIAHGERRSAQMHCFEVTKHARERDPKNYKQDVSVVLAEIELEATESRLARIIEYYRKLDLANTTQPPNTTTASPTANSPPTNTGIVIEIEDSDDEEDQGRDSSPGPPPGYTSWPATPPHFYAALLDTDQAHSPSVPSTPTRCRQDEDVGVLSQYLNAPPSAQLRQTTPATPATPRHVTSQTATIVGEGGVLTSPDPKKKHYIVTRGRRTGIYSTWGEAHAYTDGLGSSGALQGFKTYSEAFDAYMRARERGLLRVIRLSEDTEEVYGRADHAEDL